MEDFFADKFAGEFCFESGAGWGWFGEGDLRWWRGGG